MTLSTPHLLIAADCSVVRELKRDALGRVELLAGRNGLLVRRVACGNGFPGSRAIAHLLMRRERRALAALAGLHGVPALVDDDAAARVRAADGTPIARQDVLLRSWIDGTSLCTADTLPMDFFELLADLVRDLHDRGVCHNDLHKENNVQVGADGRPCLVDFQLASVHAGRGPLFRSRAREDLRHVEKHRCRYAAEGVVTRRSLPQRGLIAAIWRQTIKRGYNLVTRRLLPARTGEPRRPREGPWPTRTARVGRG